MTHQELRDKLIAMRDEVQELSNALIELSDKGEVPNTDPYALYEVYTQLASVVSSLPYDNPIAKILARNK
jgi:hypothetical protein